MSKIKEKGRRKKEEGKGKRFLPSTFFLLP
jgi:hypothetical protein